MSHHPENMARLVVNPGTPTAWEIPLKPGVNSIGRGLANDFKLTDPSVSTSHCEIVIGSDGCFIRDLGSTNGTFLNRTPIQESGLQSGQTLHLGGLEMMFVEDEPQSSTAAAPVVAAPPPPPRVTLAKAAGHPTRVNLAASTTAPPAVLSPPLQPLAGATPTHCKHHPKSPARYLCNQCHSGFCEFCVSPRILGGVQHKFCRHCGVECVPVQVPVTRPTQKKFFPSLPGVFIYPFRGTGLLVLLVATVVFTALERLRGTFSLFFTIAAIGYLFSYMQAIIHSTAAEEKEMPSLPGMDDVFGGCFRLLGCVLISFGFAIALGLLAFFNDDLRSGAMIALVPALIFGAVYFPMALLAVAMKDSVAAANPLVVASAICKVPLEYLITVIFLGCAFGFRFAGGVVLTLFSSDMYLTHSMSKLLLSLGLGAVWSFFVVYLLTVNMRTLGLLYLTKKDKLGWFNH